MGRLFDEEELQKYIMHDGCDEGCGYIDERDLKYIQPVEAIPKDQYEARLKADLEAILVELQLEIEELDSRAGYDGNGMPTFSTDYIRKKKVNEIIQQKIDKLKENMG